MFRPFVAIIRFCPYQLGFHYTNRVTIQAIQKSTEQYTAELHRRNGTATSDFSVPRSLRTICNNLKDTILGKSMCLMLHQLYCIPWSRAAQT